MAEKFFSSDDKVRRIHQSVCLWDSKPVYVLAKHGWRSIPALEEEEVLVGEMGSLDIYHHQGWTRVKYTDPLFSYEAMPLGYVNVKGHGPVYVHRSPYQQYAQGLTVSQLVLVGNASAYVSTGPLIYSKELAACIKGEYPSLEEALQNNLAFDRYFAIRNMTRSVKGLEFQGRLIGSYSKKNKIFKLWESRACRIISKALHDKGINHVIEDDS